MMNKIVLSRALTLALVASVLAAPKVEAKLMHGKKTTHKAASAKKHQPPGKPVASGWTPDPKLLSQLQPETQFGAFSMRLPPGYTVEQHNMSDPTIQVTGYMVTGPKRTEGSFPVIFVLVGIATPGLRTGSADSLLDGNAVINEKPDLVKSSVEDGEVNGLQMVRQYYKYPVRPGSSRLFHGFHYATTDGQTDALVGAMDVEPDNATTLPLAEAAVLTLHKTL